MRIEDKLFFRSDLGRKIEFDKFNDSGIRGLIRKLDENGVYISKFINTKITLREEEAEEFKEVEPTKYILNNPFLAMTLERGYRGSEGAHIEVDINLSWGSDEAFTIYQNIRKILSDYFVKD